MGKEPTVAGPARFGGNRSTGGEWTNVGVENLGINLRESMTLQAGKIAEHEGKIAGLGTAVQAFQTSLSFIQSVGIGIAALILAGLAVVVSLQVGENGRNDSRFDKMDARLGSVQTKVDQLPGSISRELRETSRDMALLAGGRTPPARECPRGEPNC